MSSSPRKAAAAAPLEATRVSARTLIGLALIGSAYALALGAYKSGWQDRRAGRAIRFLRVETPRLLQLQQAGPGASPGGKPVVEEVKRLASRVAGLERVVILQTGSQPGSQTGEEPGGGPGGESKGRVTFDSAPGLPVSPDPGSILTLSAQGPRVILQGTRVQILIPSDGRAVLYTLGDSGLRLRLGIALAVGLLFLLALGILWERGGLSGQVSALVDRAWRLRAKFTAAILLVNGVTAAIIFFSLASLQTAEQTRRIERQSVIFARFSTDRVISVFMRDFSNRYADRFLPEIREIIAANEDLDRIRILSARTHHVFFDSEQALSGSESAGDLPRAIDEELRSRDLATLSSESGGVKSFSVINTYRTPAQEPVFLVEYLFNYERLRLSLDRIRGRILLDLIPAMALGLLIAMLFAQLLILPIRRLVEALRRVSTGDFSASVAITSRDEIGSLGETFNAMTDELRRKRELRKFLSHTSYQRITGDEDEDDGWSTAGAEAGGKPGPRPWAGGSRVSATILFSDIRDFVAHCESLEAEEITSMLNEYFSEMVEVVHGSGGEVDKFIGDAILAVFYEDGPDPGVDSPREAGGGAGNASVLRAISCALGMRARLAELNTRRESLGRSRLEIGIGISHGDIISGPIGSENRMDFTVIGDVVNLANRLEKLSKRGRHTRIVFSHQVEEKVRGLMDYEEIETEGGIRGKKEEVRVFELIAIKELAVLSRNLQSGELELRLRSAALLGQSGNPRAIDALLPMLEDGDPEVRIAVARALARLEPLARADGSGDPGASVESALFSRIGRESSEKVLSVVISSIGRISRRGRLLELAPFLESPSERIVANTIEALGQSRGPDATDLILPKLDSRNNRIKANAAMAIFASGHLEVIHVLKPMLMHSDPLMRSSSAFAIGELTAIGNSRELARGLREGASGPRAFLAELQESVPMLIALLKDPEPKVRRQAVIALGKIRDRSAVLPLIEMIDLNAGPGTLSARGSRELARDILEAVRTIGSHRTVREVLTRLSN